MVYNFLFWKIKLYEDNSFLEKDRRNYKAKQLTISTSSQSD